MSPTDNYGVVYTPDALSEFVAELLVEEWMADPDWGTGAIRALDPACGEGALLKALEAKTSQAGLTGEYAGVDVSQEAIYGLSGGLPRPHMKFYSFDAILPEHREETTLGYWKKVLPDVNAIIANPPWSSQKIYDKEELTRAGFRLNVGQFDSYVLFVELSIHLLKEKGLCALILPDSLFSGENKALRRYLARETQIKVIARLGEKLFPDVNRAASVLILKKALPDARSMTKCFRLTTEERKAFLADQSRLSDFYHKERHVVRQSRFTGSPGCFFDVDTRREEEELLLKLEQGRLEWRDTFQFARGVEISKKGQVASCAGCGQAQGFTSRQRESGKKKCSYCGEEMDLSEASIEKIITSCPGQGFTKIYVGEDIHRYGLSGGKYIKLNVEGINYKDPSLYAPPKILVRKTGLGINGAMDYNGTYISQTVYSCRFKGPSPWPIEYYLGVLNSRVMFYYYTKRYGENEWKSHPYITKDILFSLPVKMPDPESWALCRQIAELAAALCTEYSREKDMELEQAVMKLYGITGAEECRIRDTLNALPDLGAINGMKF